MFSRTWQIFGCMCVKNSCTLDQWDGGGVSNMRPLKNVWDCSSTCASVKPLGILKHNFQVTKLGVFKETSGHWAVFFDDQNVISSKPLPNVFVLKANQTKGTALKQNKDNCKWRNSKLQHIHHFSQRSIAVSCLSDTFMSCFLFWVLHCLFLFHDFSLLVKAWRLHYLQCNSPSASSRDEELQRAGMLYSF